MSVERRGFRVEAMSTTDTTTALESDSADDEIGHGPATVAAYYSRERVYFSDLNRELALPGGQDYCLDAGAR